LHQDLNRSLAVFLSKYENKSQKSKVRLKVSWNFDHLGSPQYMYSKAQQFLASSFFSVFELNTDRQRDRHADTQTEGQQCPLLSTSR